MGTVTMKVDGLRALGERMQKLSRETSLKIARSATNAAAQVVKKSAIRKAPESTEAHMLEGVLVQPGNLKKNIVVKRVNPSKTALTSEHLVTVRGKKKDGYAARYGRLQEFGTVKQSPHPFLQPALAENIPTAIEAMKKIMGRRIEAAARK